jgi:hypothetical protein
MDNGSAVVLHRVAVEYIPGKDTTIIMENRFMSVIISDSDHDDVRNLLL